MGAVELTAILGAAIITMLGAVIVQVLQLTRRNTDQHIENAAAIDNTHTDIATRLDQLDAYHATLEKRHEIIDERHTENMTAHNQIYEHILELQEHLTDHLGSASRNPD